MARGELPQQREVGGWVFAGRRDAHEPDHGQHQIVPAPRDQRIEAIRQDSGLLRLGPGIDLNEAVRTAALALHLAGQRSSQLRPIDRMDGVGDGHRVADLVGLQRADVVKRGARPFGAERLPFLARLLHPVLAIGRVAGGKRRQDPACGMSLGDRDQRNLAPAASCGTRRILDLGRDGGQIGGDIDGRRVVSPSGRGCVRHGDLN